MSAIRVLAAAAVVCVASACGPKVRPDVLRRAALADLARADARALEGCYACLRDARDGYVRLIPGPAAGLAAERRFEMELLIFLRERELAIDTAATVTRLQAAAAALPADMDRARLMALADLVPPNDAGISDAATLAFVRGHLAAQRTLVDGLRWLNAIDVWPPVREYLALSLECANIGRPYRRVAQALLAQPGDSPLVAYRRALCGSADSLATLDHLYDASPVFTEAAYVYARTASIAAAKTTRIRRYVAAAYAALPQSPAVTFLAGTSAQLGGDCRAALRHYDETLALAPRHESAQLGRAACLTYLNRLDEAIDTATALISWQSTNQRDAYYWRAYDHRLQQHLDLARADIDQSKARGVSVENETLAGMIEYDQHDLDPARGDLETAWGLSRASVCAAAWYLGLVHIARDDWASAGTGFERATGCYGRNVSEDRAGLAEMEAHTDLDAEFGDAQIANFKVAIDEDLREQRTAIINAATAAVNVANPEKARSLLAQAAGDPSLADAIAALTKFLDEHYPLSAAQ